MVTCLFCELKKGWIYEDEYFYSIFDINPASPGHALIIPKRHAVSILDLDKKEWLQLRETIGKVLQIIESTNKKKLYEQMMSGELGEKSKSYCRKMLQHPNLNHKPDGYNIGNNEGEAAGRTIHHFHLQIIPRYKGDVTNHAGGIRHIIPEMGNYTD